MTRLLHLHTLSSNLTNYFYLNNKIQKSIINTSNSKTCVRCKRIVNKPRAVSWDYNKCPQCMILSDMMIVFHAFYTLVYPMTAYLNRYTPFEMKSIEPTYQNS